VEVKTALAADGKRSTVERRFLSPYSHTLFGPGFPWPCNDEYRCSLMVTADKIRHTVRIQQKHRRIS
jgi:hypothetical protein